MLPDGIYQMSFKIDLILDHQSELGIELGWISPPVEKVRITRETTVGGAGEEGKALVWSTEKWSLQGTAESLSN